MTDVWALTVKHGDNLDHADYAALQTVRRTLLGLLDHGFITELNTYSGRVETRWSYRAGTENPGQIMAGLLDTVEVIKLDHWSIEVNQR